MMHRILIPAVIAAALWLPARAAEVPLGLPPVVDPPDNPTTPEKVALGDRLFHDVRFSSTGTVSCATCHDRAKAFTDSPLATSKGIQDKTGTRNAPTVLNVAWLSVLFHDGRESSLETQAWGPLLHPDEMANPSAGHLLERLRARPEYRGRFEAAFAGRGASMDTVGGALAAYQRTLVAADSRFDRWRWGGQREALSAQERRGFDLFTGKAACARCHTVEARHALFTDQRFHVTGAGTPWQPRGPVVVPLATGVQTTVSPAERAAYEREDAPDHGRWDISQRPEDRFAFRTPSLRNVSRTAPYMHDGSLPTLQAVVDFYAAGGGPVPDRSPLLRPIDLDGAERQALVAFLKSLDSQALPSLVRQAR